VTRLFVDADACPVRAEAIAIGLRFGAEILIVSNGGIRPDPNPSVLLIVVPEGPDAADRWIAERIGPGDVCVTADVPLAARCVAAGAEAIRHDGEAFTAASIGGQLALRDLMADLRSARPLAAGGSGRGFTRADRSRFRDRLDRMLRAAARR
jgi:hypothetical protein